ncbi:MAG: hypothetical protein QNJ57_07750 [Flavobacteriaceae bacterium]|nr:hypothetical protein [Flavobacteriaceae bacterium]
MTKETFCEAERRRLDKLNKFQLPHKFKKIGWSIVLMSFLLMIAKIFFNEPLWVKTVLNNIFLLGLLMVSISKEKVEDELIVSLRAQSYRLAFTIGVLYAIIQPLIEYFVDTLLQKEPSLGFSYFQVLIFMLFIQLAFFESLKKIS